MCLRRAADWLGNWFEPIRVFHDQCYVSVVPKDFKDKSIKIQ